MDNHKVYVYKTTKAEDFKAVACDCQIWDKSDFKGLVFLDPPDRGHMIEGSLVSDSDDGFVFRSIGYDPGEWEFKVLTIENLRRSYYKIVIDGSKLADTLKTTEDLHRWFRDEFHFG
jgi:hypothetical protein